MNTKALLSILALAVSLVSATSAMAGPSARGVYTRADIEGIRLLSRMP